MVLARRRTAVIMFCSGFFHTSFHWLPQIVGVLSRQTTRPVDLKLRWYIPHKNQEIGSSFYTNLSRGFRGEGAHVKRIQRIHGTAPLSTDS
jgi:hypothetical protein